MTLITSQQNDRVKQLVDLGLHKKARLAAGVFVCEGEVMLNEAVLRGACIVDLYFREGFVLPIDLAKKLENIAAFSLSDGVFERVSDVVTPQNVIFTVKIPENKQIFGNKILALENVRDPGNLGTIIRTANALGIDCVALVGDCGEVYNPKVVRASMGTIFADLVAHATFSDLENHAKSANIPVFCAVLGENAANLSQKSIGNSIVLIGNEAHGLSKNAADLGKKIAIPMQNAESLNVAVAAAIFAWEMVR